MDKEQTDSTPAEAVVTDSSPTGSTGSAGSGKVDSDSSITDLETALKELEKVRRESARRRIKEKENEAAAKKWQEHLDSQKTEMERMTERQAELEAELSALRTEKLQRDIAAEVGLDPEMAEFIRGESESEMRESAQKLADKFSVSSPSMETGLLAGSRGEPVKPRQSGGGGAFLSQLAEEGSVTTSFN